ncbi:MAG: HepT-like ribonuclease domain-containing protein [Terracidiphilus sp.]
MPSNALAALADIEQYIELATQFVEGFDYEGFLDDTRTVLAVTRCLEVISEASRRLPDELKARYPSIPWKEIAGAGNVYRHDYEDVAAKMVWDTVQLALTPLMAVVAQEIDRLCSEQE